MVRAAISPVCGKPDKFYSGLALDVRDQNPLRRLVQIVKENDAILARLDVLGRRLGRARGYADDPSSSPALAAALLEQARRRYAEALARLRSNRAEALGILRAAGHAEAF